MPNALIFSPDLDGHRQLYVFVLSHILEELGFKIFVAANPKKKVTNSFYIDKLNKNPEINLIDTNTYTIGGLNFSIKDFLKLQNDTKSDLTILAEADPHFQMLISQIFRKKNKLRGKVVGIFMRPFYYYREKNLLSKLRFIKHFFSRWNRDEQLFFEFFLKKFSILDVVFSIDENFVSKHRNFKWLPDVFQQYADSIVAPNENFEQRLWIDKLNAFKSKNKENFFFLYFGTAQNRRGYDTLLKLAEETGGCFIHCGLRDMEVNYHYNTNEIISNLKKEDKFFETNEYIEDPLCVEHFFKSVSHLILPYKTFYGSSGVMLQALNYGIPVLAPDSAIIGYRIKNYNLGQTYTEKDINSLISQFYAFSKLNPKSFEKDIKSYMNFQTATQLKNALTNAFSGTEKSVKLPS